ncbi:Copper-translocating P-type ATPase [Synechococcus sp. CC9902]|uniref:heavy metal translocating P-type ATPase n=1 Tax=Synechococcus sp. (strain CC9902) TaxID=316279 RepID=UPI00005D3DCD|nr:heavy metal translocating P-type ATPase [Synechococcus sp. CC9902]ABB25284.1 Copper-translocating P-type ATPase [Synechococcus sp. CC9902]
MQTVVLDVEGMKCGGCVSAVERTLLEQPGVQRADVNLVSRAAWLDLAESDGNVDEVLAALAARGFPARERSLEFQPGLKGATGSTGLSWWRQWRQLMVALVLLLLSVMGHLSEAGQLSVPVIGSLPFHAGLATVALFGPGRQILSGGIKAARVGAPSMDTLVGLGVGSAYLASLAALVWPTVGWPCFFNEPVMLLGFVLLGRFLEERARFRTGQALQQLAQLQPETARLVLTDGEIREVRVGALRPGERVQLLAGDRIPVDGVVREGLSAVDVSSLTGEPMPLQVEPGTELSSGSLNLEAPLVLEVSRVGSDTALARIIRLVEQAQARRAPIQGLADRVAGRFCYGVMALALATFLFWWLFGASHWPEVLQANAPGLPHAHGMVHGAQTHHSGLGSGATTPIGLALQLTIAVLVVACPCALGLATPTVITVSTGLAARRGWLFRGGDVIETAAALDQVVFDKTGTLTLGRPLVTDVFGEDPNLLLQWAASLEQSSRHPLAYALLQEAQRRDLALIDVTRVSTVSGEGLWGELDGVVGDLRVGKPAWLQSFGVDFSAGATAWLAAAQGSVVAVSAGQVLVGLLQVEDKQRPDVAPSLERLRASGLKLAIFSGDREVAVRRLGERLGFAEADLGWQMLPQQKLERLEQLRQEGRVAMVGDGINDAPALAAADLGIAIGTGTQIAQDTADMVLLGDRLDNLPEALSLARRTLNKVRQNLFWAFGYNLIALPVAAGVLLPSQGVLLSPPFAALLMALSSITVVVNALALRI